MPSSTVPSTRLVIIWLKRSLATSLTEPALESAPVGQGGNAAAALGLGGPSTAAGRWRRSGPAVGVDDEVEVDVDVDVEVEQDVGADCA